MDYADNRQHAIVLGGSMAGLLTARILSRHFTRVTILERDPVQNNMESRKGQPQTRHVHGLLASGLQIMNRYFPNLTQELAEHGAVVNDMGESMRWHVRGGYRKPFRSGLVGVSVSRPLLEWLIRRRVLALPNISLRDNCAVKQLVTADDGQRIIGVAIEQRDDAKLITRLTGDLIVDCTGRGSRLPKWLEELGYAAPGVSELQIDVGYTTRIFRRDPMDPRGRYWTTVTPHAPQETRFGAAFAIEDNRWIVSLGGWGGDHCPSDEPGFLTFANQLPAPDVYDIIRNAEPLSEIMTHKIGASIRRHYEKLRHFPLGLLALGDALASINPTYGQGMTLAAMQSQALDDLLASEVAPEKLARAFFKRAAHVIDISWAMAAGEDFRFATTSGPKPLETDLLNWYTSFVEKATHHDVLVGAAFLQVMNMLAPATILLKPNILWRVFRPRPTDAAPDLHPVIGDLHSR